MSTNSDEFEKALQRCEQHAIATSGGQFPVRLSPIAKARDVKRLWFQPLLCSALLGKDANGFMIGVAAETEQVEECTRRWETNETPVLLDSPLRFAIAHELAHTFFYQYSPDQNTEETRLSGGGGKTSHEILERNCDRIAGALLLPASMLAAVARDKLSTPDQLRQFATEAGVSLSVLVIRLSQLSEMRERFAATALLLVQRTEAGWVFLAGLFGTTLRSGPLRNLSRGDSLSLISPIGSVLRGGTESSFEATVEVRTEGGLIGKRTYAVLTEKVDTARSKRSMLVTVRETGPDDFN